MSKIIEHGDLSEWFKVRCWKRRVANTHHEFESHSLRHITLKAFVKRLFLLFKKNKHQQPAAYETNNTYLLSLLSYFFSMR